MAFYITADIDTLDLTPTELKIANEWLRVAGSLNDLSIMCLKQASDANLQSALHRLTDADDTTWTGFDTAHVNNALAGGEHNAYILMKQHGAKG